MDPLPRPPGVVIAYVGSMLSADDFPFQWTATVDTVLDESISNEVARAFLLHDEVTGNAGLETILRIASFLETGRLLGGLFRRTRLVPPMCTEDLEFERAGGVLHATLRLRTSREAWLMVFVLAILMAGTGYWQAGVILAMMPFARSIAVLEFWKSDVRRGVEELERLLAMEGGILGGRRKDHVPSLDPEPKHTAPSEVSHSPLEIDDTHNWPGNDLGAHLETLARPGVARIILADWDSEVEPAIMECEQQEEIDRWLLEQVEPIFGHLESLLGSPRDSEGGLRSDEAGSILRREWDVDGGMVALDLRSLGDRLYSLSLEDFSNRIRI